MTKETVPCTMQVFVLNQTTKQEIKMKVEKSFERVGVYGNELDEAMDIVMESKLYDLGDIIDIYSLESINVINEKKGDII